MKLYLISQTENSDYGTYDAAVVAAESEEDARTISPARLFEYDPERRAWYCEWGGVRYYSNDGEYGSGWCSTPDAVTVQCLGEANPGTERGVILGSFNRG